MAALFLASPALAQMAAPAQPTHLKRLYTDANSRLYVQAEEPVYLYLGTSPGLSGTTALLRSEQNADVTNPMHFDGPGRQGIRYKDNKLGKEIVFHVYADGSAAKSTLRLTGAPHHRSGQVDFYGVGLVAKVNSTDDLSGVQQSYLSVNGDGLESNPVPVKLEMEKAYSLFYYAVDNVGNVEEVKARHNVQVDLTAPLTGYRVEGINLNDIVPASTNIVFESNDALSGVAHINYKFNEQNRYTRYANKGLIRLEVLEDGPYTLSFHGIDNVANAEADKSYSFYLDKIAPVVSFSVQGDQYRGAEHRYVSERTTFSITATDNKAGVDAITYSIDGRDSETYEGAFTLGTQSGRHTIGFRAIDRVKNRSALERLPFYLDVTAPETQLIYRGGWHETSEVVYIAPSTRLQVVATDAESGVKSVRYKLDAADAMEFPNNPITITAPGPHELFSYGVDNVNNREGAQYTALFVDDLPPEIVATFSIVADAGSRMEGSMGTYVKGEFLYLAATDEHSGVDSIVYTINGGAEQGYHTPIRLDTEGEFTVAISSTDKVGNRSSHSVSFKVRDGSM